MFIKNIALSAVLLMMTLSSPIIFAAMQQQSAGGDNMQMMHKESNGNYMLMGMQGCQQYEQLSADQKASVAKIMDDYKNRMISVHKAIKEKTEALNAQLTQDKVDAKQVDDLTKAISDLRGQVFAEHVKANMAVKQSTGFSPVVCMHKRGRSGGGMMQGMMQEEGKAGN